MTAAKLAKSLGFMLQGHSGNGHQKWVFTDRLGINHMVTGFNKHKNSAHTNDMHRLRQRMHRCVEGKCDHVRRVHGN